MEECAQRVIEWAELCLKAENPWLAEMQQIQERMSRSGAHIRSVDALKYETPEAWGQVRRLAQAG
ncbi:unnamed protein product, partial [marine sediment metagenome]